MLQSLAVGFCWGPDVPMDLWKLKFSRWLQGQNPEEPIQFLSIYMSRLVLHINQEIYLNMGVAILKTMVTQESPIIDHSQHHYYDEYHYYHHYYHDFIMVH